MTEDGTDDIISRGVEICSRMPRGAAEWKDPLDRAAEIVREREAFIDELALQLEHEGELSAEAVDAIWLSTKDPAEEPNKMARYVDLLQADAKTQCAWLSHASIRCQHRDGGGRDAGADRKILPSLG